MLGSKTAYGSSDVQLSGSRKERAAETHRDLMLLQCIFSGDSMSNECQTTVLFWSRLLRALSDDKAVQLIPGLVAARQPIDRSHDVEVA